MRRRHHIWLTMLAVVAALGAAGAALAAFTPRLVVTGSSTAAGGSGPVKIRFTAPQADEPTAKATVYVPLGYRLTAATSPGTRIGTAVGSFHSADLAAVVPVTGTIEVAAPAEFATQATACTGTTTHSATWALRLRSAGTALPVPVFVDRVTGSLARLAAVQLAICLSPPDLPPGTPGRAPVGAKLLNLELTTSAIQNPTAHGEYRWRTLAVPFTPAVGTMNTAGSVEVQSLVTLPTEQTLKGKVLKPAKKGYGNVTFAGALLANLKGIPNARVEVLRGPTASGVKRFKVLTTDGNGAFSGAYLTKQAPTARDVYLVAHATLAERNLGPAGCKATFVPPLAPVAVPCVAASVGTVTVSSPVLRVSVPAAPTTKKKRR
jgi:hypothetical protein